MRALARGSVHGVFKCWSWQQQILSGANELHVNHLSSPSSGGWVRQNAAATPHERCCVELRELGAPVAVVVLGTFSFPWYSVPHLL